MEYDIDIFSLVYGGYGFGRLPDGKAVFVPYVLPGENVRIRIQEDRKRHAYGELLEINKSSELRITPKCKHFMHCGGCHYQHIPYDQQLLTKRDIFIEQLQRMGNIQDPVIEKIIPSNHAWHYRNAVQFHIDKSGALAFMNALNAQAFKVTECYLPLEEIGTIWPLLSFQENESITRVELRQNEKDDVLLILHDEKSEIPEIEISASISTVHTSQNDRVVISGNDHLIIKLLDKEFKVSAGSFFQTNFHGAEEIVRSVTKMIEGLSGTMYDLYSGVGLFSSFLAESFTKIIAIEASGSACSDFAINLDHHDHISLFQGVVERVLPKIETLADCVIVDPPRKGMNRYAIDALVEKKPPIIIYVSCNPSTLARDVKRLMHSGYKLEHSILVDMFPQTYHIESVNYLTLS